MITDEIIGRLNHLTVESSEDYAQLDYLGELAAHLESNHDGQRACQAILSVLERHPHVDFGTPGQLVHALESYRGHYETLLQASLDRQPTALTIWLLNRVINAAGPEKPLLLAHLRRLRGHPRADAQAQAAIEEFYRFQEGEV